MKKLLYSLTLCSCLFVTAQSAGVFLGEGENNGKSFVIGSDASVATVQKIAKDYSAKDAAALMSNYTTEFAERASEWSTEWLGSMETISMDPYMIIPVKMKDSENTMVLAWSTEDRNFKDGSIENLNLMEIFTVDKDNKVMAFGQWSNRLKSSNFGLNYGGKFIGDGESEWSGRPLVFSNRGEVEAIEKLVADYNNKDASGCSEAFAEEDYANIFTKKQPEYNSTNFNFSYNPNDDLSFSFDVENLFENSYGTRLRDDVIYPGNSTRNIKAGLTYKF